MHTMEAYSSVLKSGDASLSLEALQTYVGENKDKFQFEETDSVVTNFVSDVFQYLGSDIVCRDGQRYGLNALRILTRQKAGFRDVLTEKGALRLVRFTGADSDIPVEDATAVESLKCLCNLTYQHHSFSDNIAGCEGAVAHLLQQISSKDAEYDIRFYSARLIFLMSAVNQSLRSAIRQADGLHRLCGGVLAALGLTGNEGDCATIGELSQQCGDLAAEVMKCVFNISMEVSKEPTEKEIQSVMLLVKMARIVLSSPHLMGPKDINPLRSQVTYMLINMPPNCDDLFLPKTHSQFGTGNTVIYNYRNVTAAEQLLRQLDEETTGLCSANISSATGNDLVPLVTAIANCARACPVARRYWRQKVLPTLGNVVSRPDEGNSLKARLVRLMTSPHTNLAATVAEFLFVLCKENAGRFVKYTGYGNAAGLLLQRGMLGGGKGEQTADYSSDSDDSDTEEYRESRVNVMTGGPEAQDQVDPLAGMTEEEKEAEAERLGELMTKLENTGVMKVMRVGGTPSSAAAPDTSAATGTANSSESASKAASACAVSATNEEPAPSSASGCAPTRSSEAEETEAAPATHDESTPADDSSTASVNGSGAA
ncbi:synembryn-A-like [Sycon ciliatum]|uniref:synembryn-A-like n=1 Tax=Sycon ciliatum TaxID=27933 RepID=UPI0031F66A3F